MGCRCVARVDSGGVRFHTSSSGDSRKPGRGRERHDRAVPAVRRVVFVCGEQQPAQPAHGFYTQSLSTPEGPSLFGSETVRVTCLDSLGSGDAVLGGVVSATSDPRLVVGDVFWAQIHDGRPTATPDAMSFAFVSDTPALDFGGDFPFSCATPLWSNPLPIKPLLSGQIAVADPLS